MHPEELAFRHRITELEEYLKYEKDRCVKLMEILAKAMTCVNPPMVTLDNRPAGKPLDLT